MVNDSLICLITWQFYVTWPCYEFPGMTSSQRLVTHLSCLFCNMNTLQGRIQGEIGKNIICWRKISHEIPQQFSRLPPLGAIFLSAPPPLIWNPGSAPSLYVLWPGYHTFFFNMPTLLVKQRNNILMCVEIH